MKESTSLVTEREPLQSESDTQMDAKKYYRDPRLDLNLSITRMVMQHSDALT